MSRAVDELETLRTENQALREQLAKAKRRVTRAMAQHQNHALSMETIRQNNEELDRLTAQLAARNRENEALVESLRSLVEQLSTPVLQVGPDVLALPIIGAVDDHRAVTIIERALTEVGRVRARWIVLDLTGASLVDEHTVGLILQLARTIRLLGARCVLCGVQPAIARALVDLDVELGAILSVRNLSQALALIRAR